MTEDKGILIGNVYYMLSYAFRELRATHFQSIAGEAFEELHDLMAEIIAKGVACRLKQGLHREYVEVSGQLMTLRGKLQLGESIKLKASARHQLACEYDEFSADNLFNRILKSTMLLLLRHPLVKPKRKDALRRVLSFFTDIGETDLSAVRWTRLRFDRNSRPYKMLMYFCYFVTDNILLSTDTGKYTVQAFADNKMSRLFERFVLEYYRRHYPQLAPAARQINWNIVEDESTLDILPILQTDIMLTRGERTLIIDTKYYSRTLQSRYEKLSIHSHNLHQICNYVYNHDRGHTGMTDGMLLYARTKEEVQPDGYLKTADGNIIYFQSLDLNTPFENIRAQLDAIAEKLNQPK